MRFRAEGALQKSLKALGVHQGCGIEWGAHVLGTGGGAEFSGASGLAPRLGKLTALSGGHSCSRAEFGEKSH